MVQATGRSDNKFHTDDTIEVNCSFHLLEKDKFVELNLYKDNNKFFNINETKKRKFFIKKK